LEAKPSRRLIVALNLDCWNKVTSDCDLAELWRETYVKSIPPQQL